MNPTIGTVPPPATVNGPARRWAVALDAGLIPQKITASPGTSTSGSYPFTPTVPAEVQYGHGVRLARAPTEGSHSVTMELDDRRRHSTHAVGLSRSPRYWPRAALIVPSPQRPAWTVAACSMYALIAVLAASP